MASTVVETEGNKVHLVFHSHGSVGTALEALGIWGQESLDTLFEYRVLLRNKLGLLGDEDVDDLAYAGCHLEVGQGPHDVIHGLVRSIDLVEGFDSEPGYYVASVVPRLWLLSLSRLNRVFQKKTVADMARIIFASYGMKEGPGRDFEIRVSESGKNAPEHEFVVQYEESDFDFLKRWFEHEGFFFWFEHGSELETLVIADGNLDCPPLPEREHVDYRDKNNLGSGGTSIYEWRMSQQRIPGRVAVVDYNYRQPRSTILKTAEVDKKYGFGCVYSYGEHFRTEKAAQRIATLRAERYRATRKVFSGMTDTPSFKVGYRFVLEGHPHESWGGKAFLITQIEHWAGRVFPGIPVPPREAPSNQLRFSAIHAEIPYRPERRTPWPSIHGLMHAYVDSETEGSFADLDDQGRYLVRLPFDLAGARGKASQRMRLLQPFAGSNHGTHYPLHRGTEVMLAFLDGDPDRPVIVGAVNNPVTPSTSTAANANVYGTRGPGGSFSLEYHYATNPGGAATPPAAPDTDAYESSAWHETAATGAPLLAPPSDSPRVPPAPTAPASAPERVPQPPPLAAPPLTPQRGRGKGLDKFQRVPRKKDS